MHDVIRFGKALQDPVRIRILACLRGHELCKCELFAALADVSPSRLEVHLKVLRDSGLIVVGRLNRWSTYKISDSYEHCIDEVFSTFQTDIAWDERVTSDLARLGPRLQGRQGGWCA